jgi:hypothetical protein
MRATRGRGDPASYVAPPPLLRPHDPSLLWHAHRPRRRRLRPRAERLQRDDRPPPGADRPLRICRRHRRRAQVRPGRGPRGGGEGGRPCRARVCDHRRQRRDRPQPAEGHPGRSGAPDRLGAARRAVGRAGRGDAGARPGHHRRARVVHRRGRLHARLRQRLAGAQDGPGRRQPARRAGAHRRGRGGHRVRAREPRAVLGPARRRRQLRDRRGVRVFAAPRRPDRARRPDAVAAGPRGRGGARTASSSRAPRTPSAAASCS